MKKNLKKLIALGMVVASVMSSTVTSYAGEYEMKLNNYHNAPSCNVGDWCDRPAATRLETKEANAYGKNTYVEFTVGNNLPSLFESNNDREMLVYFMELDSDNNNDKIASYKGQYDGRKLTKIVLNRREIEGKIEAAGDKQAEFYIIYMVNKMPSDKSDYEIPDGHFQYRYGFSK